MDKPPMAKCASSIAAGEWQFRAKALEAAAPIQAPFPYFAEPGRPFVTAGIPGATTPEQLDMALDAVDFVWTSDMQAAVDAIHHRCGNPCPGVDRSVADVDQHFWGISIVR